jgi:hypothetical protein
METIRKYIELIKRVLDIYRCTDFETQSFDEIIERINSLRKELDTINQECIIKEVTNDDTIQNIIIQYNAAEAMLMYDDSYNYLTHFPTSFNDDSWEMLDYIKGLFIQRIYQEGDQDLVQLDYSKLYQDIENDSNYIRLINRIHRLFDKANAVANRVSNAMQALSKRVYNNQGNMANALPGNPDTDQANNKPNRTTSSSYVQIENNGVLIPKELNTKQVKDVLCKAVKSGLLDGNYKPTHLMTKAMMALLADELYDRELVGYNRYSIFEKWWDKKGLAKCRYSSIEIVGKVRGQEKILALFK